MTIPDISADEYRIDITAADRRGASGWRVQVSWLDGDGTAVPLLSESPRIRFRRHRPVGLWCATYSGALHLGLSEAHELHAIDVCTSLLPIVVHHGEATLVDGRPGRVLS